MSCTEYFFFSRLRLIPGTISPSKSSKAPLFSSSPVTRRQARSPSSAGNMKRLVHTNLSELARVYNKHAHHNYMIPLAALNPAWPAPSATCTAWMTSPTTTQRIPTPLPLRHRSLHLHSVPQALLRPISASDTPSQVSNRKITTTSGPSWEETSDQTPEVLPRERSQAAISAALFLWVDTKCHFPPNLVRLLIFSALSSLILHFFFLPNAVM